MHGGAATYDDVAQVLDASDFYLSRSAVIFDAMGQVVSAGNELDSIAILEALRKAGEEDKAGGISAIMSISDVMDTPMQAGSLAKIVKEKSKLRQIIRMSRLAIENCMSQSEDPELIGAQLEGSLQGMGDKTADEHGIAVAARELKDDYTKMIAGEYEIQSLPTGIDHLDDKLPMGGVCDGEVFVISAPTSCGKTQLALNITLRAGVTHSIPGLYFSFEMQSKSLASRMAQTASACNLKQLREGVMAPDKQKRVWDALDRLESAPIYTEHYVRSVEDLRSKARTYKRKHGIKWIVIDYLQLVPFDKRMKKHDGIAEVSHQIKLMAMELNLPVILLAQVNREGAKRESGLTLYDLKDSGDIENDADLILLMWPDGVDVDDARKIDGTGSPYVSLKYNLAKCREGERDQKGKFMFRNHIGRFH